MVEFTPVVAEHRICPVVVPIVIPSATAFCHDVHVPGDVAKALDSDVCEYRFCLRKPGVYDPVPITVRCVAITTLHPMPPVLVMSPAA